MWLVVDAGWEAHLLAALILGEPINEQWLSRKFKEWIIQRSQWEDFAQVLLTDLKLKNTSWGSDNFTFIFLIMLLCYYIKFNRMMYVKTHGAVFQPLGLTDE